MHLNNLAEVIRYGLSRYFAGVGSRGSLKKLLTSKGMTLVEVLIAVGILVFCVAGILGAYSTTFILADIARKATIANSLIQAKMEELKKKDYNTLASYNGTTFDLSGIIGKGRIEVRDMTAYTNMKEIRIVVSFRSLKRVIGEDVNLNGTLDTGEDANGNTRLDSPVELITLVAK